MHASARCVLFVCLLTNRIPAEASNSFTPAGSTSGQYGRERSAENRLRAEVRGCRRTRIFYSGGERELGQVAE